MQRWKKAMKGKPQGDPAELSRKFKEIHNAPEHRPSPENQWRGSDEFRATAKALKQHGIRTFDKLDKAAPARTETVSGGVPGRPQTSGARTAPGRTPPHPDGKQWSKGAEKYLAKVGAADGERQTETVTGGVPGRPQTSGMRTAPGRTPPHSGGTWVAPAKKEHDEEFSRKFMEMRDGKEEDADADPKSHPSFAKERELRAAATKAGAGGDIKQRDALSAQADEHRGKWTGAGKPTNPSANPAALRRLEGAANHAKRVMNNPGGAKKLLEARDKLKAGGVKFTGGAADKKKGPGPQVETGKKGGRYYLSSTGKKIYLKG